ncbi:hypothetical protein MPC4_190019 [Methylocella tundrae]|uniref:Uncharacterized protein n=1 Tax=Methylocella tundrae TaxID=227605 RepID=A0A8B6M4I9_METTU|nr:hypothetical protein MPC4_190019 [Methylocella tundrae]
MTQEDAFWHMALNVAGTDDNFTIRMFSYPSELVSALCLEVHFECQLTFQPAVTLQDFERLSEGFYIQIPSLGFPRQPFDLVPSEYAF